MTQIRQFFCDYCNPGRVETGNEEKSYVAVDGDEFPTGWWEVPGKGAGRGHVGHACPDCVLHGRMDGAGVTVMDDIRQRRDAQTRAMVDGMDDGPE